jgi:glycosyltransferase involved in cell wall biosynthesis
MRVGLIIYGSLDTVSGGYLYDRKLVEHLRACGDEVEVISLPWRSYLAHLLDNVSPALRRRLNSTRYDLLLQDELNHPSLFFLNRLREGRCPRLAIVHHLRCNEARPGWERAVYRAVERRYLRSVDGFILNSSTTRAAVEALGAGGRPAVVAYPGGDRLGPPLDPDQVRRRAAGPGPLRLLFVGNLIPRKGLHTLLDALRQIPAGWELRIAGSTGVDPAYTALIRRRMVSLKPASILGPLDDRGLAAQYALSDLLVVPSSYEGFGIVYLEGMGFGLPAIASTAGAAHEIIQHGENGFLVPPGDPAALAACIQTLVGDRARLPGMSLAALDRHRRHPTWAQSAAQIRKFLQQMLNYK